jgi:hypothetical protein
MKETDAIALNYGYFADLQGKFKDKVQVLFIGIGFMEAQAFLVEYSQV